MSTEKKTKQIYFCRIRVLASMAIVILHTYTMYGTWFKDRISEAETRVTRVVPYLMMWAVPCFVMVSGALLLGPEKKITPGKLFGKYILRMLAVLLIFTTAFYFLDLWMDHKAFTSSSIKEILRKFATDGSWAHLWYLYLLVGLYLMLPFYRLIAKNASAGELKYLMILYAVFCSVLPALKALTGFSVGFYICVATIYPLYFFMGYLIHKDIVKIGTIFSLILTVGGFFLILLISQMAFGSRQDTIDNLLQNYSFLPVIVLSVGIFALIRNLGSSGGKKGEETKKFWLFMDRYSFGVYLTHMILLRFMIKVVQWNPFSYGSFWMLLPVAIAVYAVSLATSILLKWIPGLRKIL